jgi:hypothetical protein
MSKKPIPASQAGTDYEALADWAETALELHPDQPRTLTGSAAADSGRALLEGALGGPDAVRRAVRGRPAMDPAGSPARARQVRLPRPLDTRAQKMIQTGRIADFSTLMRAALTEYLEHDEHDEHDDQPTST